MTLASTTLDGYNGWVEVVMYRRSWWRRLLRPLGVGPKLVRQPVFVDVKGDRARCWTREKT